MDKWELAEEIVEYIKAKEGKDVTVEEVYEFINRHTENY